MSSHQHNKVSRVGWLDFSIVTTIRLKQPPSILRRVRKNPVRIFRDFILQILG